MMQFVLRIAAIYIVFSCSPFLPSAVATPVHIVLTWQNDTATTMTVNVHTTTADAVSVRFDTSTQGGIPGNYPSYTSGASHQIPGLDAHTTRHIHTIELTGLTPGQSYFAVAGDAVNGYSSEFKFRTVPDGDQSIRFVTGGDIGIAAPTEDMLIEAASHDPDFAVFGGDLAYANGLLASYAAWDTLLSWWQQHMVTSTGHTIPLVLAIGNHEVVGGYDQFADPTLVAPFYFGYFAQYGSGFSDPRRAHFRMEFGENMSLYIVDSSHVTPVDDQGSWLGQQLAADSRNYKFAAYHFPMYPSHRSFSSSISEDMRTHWRPHFDAHNFVAGFENHDHILKRTHPLTNDEPSADGVLYLGDGCFGRPPRAGDQAMRLDDPGTYPNELSNLGLTSSYLSNWESTNHFWVVTIPAGPPESGKNIIFEAYDENGVLLDATQANTGDFIVLPMHTEKILTALIILLTGAVIVRRRMVL